MGAANSLRLLRTLLGDRGRAAFGAIVVVGALTGCGAADETTGATRAIDPELDAAAEFVDAPLEALDVDPCLEAGSAGLVSLHDAGKLGWCDEAGALWPALVCSVACGPVAVDGGWEFCLCPAPADGGAS